MKEVTRLDIITREKNWSFEISEFVPLMKRTNNNVNVNVKNVKKQKKILLVENILNVYL